MARRPIDDGSAEPGVSLFSGAPPPQKCGAALRLAPQRARRRLPPSRFELAEEAAELSYKHGPRAPFHPASQNIGRSDLLAVEL